MSFPGVALPLSPHEGGRQATRDSLQAWIASEAFVAVLDAFGAPDLPADLGAQLATLDDFSAEHWDFRGGKERNEARRAELEPDVEELVLSAAEALGLRGQSTPRFDEYDHILILGGLVRACILRPRLARKLVDDGLRVGEITGLGAFRELRGDELELVKVARIPSATNEVEAMTSGMVSAFGLGEPDSVEGDESESNLYRRWLVTKFSGLPPLTIVAAPTRDDARRANTPDTYEYWAQNIARLDQNPGSRILLVTSAIYIPFQHAGAVRMLALPHRAIVDTVGVNPFDTTDQEFRQTFTAGQYLQEFRSTITAYRALLADLHG